MDPDSIIISCKKCEKSHSMKSMLQHVLRAKRCKGSFNEEQILSLRKHSNDLSSAKKKIRDHERYKRMKAKG